MEKYYMMAVMKGHQSAMYNMGAYYKNQNKIKN
jgi:TPR repeat protein